jgi:hypothetical protein
MAVTHPKFGEETNFEKRDTCLQNLKVQEITTTNLWRVKNNLSHRFSVTT